MKNAKVGHGWALTLLLALLMAGCGADDVTPEQHVERARVGLESGEIRAAIIELKNALQAEPNNGGARLLLGQAYARSGDGVSAQKELGRARELGVSEADLQPWLAKAHLLKGELEALYELEIPSDAPLAIRAELMRIQAQALLAKGDAERAEGLARQALELEPGSAATMVLTARIQASQGKVDDAREWISKALGIDQANASAWSLLGDIERSQGNPEAAEEAYAKAMDDPVLADTIRLNRAVVLIEAEQWDRAQAAIDELRKRIKKHPRIDYAEGLLNYKQQRYADAARLAEAALGVDPDFMPALFLAGASRFALGNAASASSHLTRYLAGKPDDVAAQRMMAAVRLQLGDAAGAEKIVEPIVERFPEDVVALNLLANAMISQGKKEESVVYLERVKAVQPESAQAQARLGAVLLDQGEAAEGIRELERALQADPTLQGAAERVVLGHARSGNLDEALKAAIENRDKNPASAGAELLLGTVYLLREERDAASQAFLKALDMDPGNPAASAALAALALEKKDWEKAKAYCLESLKHHPNNVAALVNLARIAAMQGDRDAMKRYLEDAIERAPKALEPRLYLARYYLMERKPEKCLAVLADVRQAHRNDPKLLAVAAEAELALARYADARITLEALRELSPTDLKIRVALAGVYTGLGDNEKARAELEEAVRLDPKFLPAIKALAVLAIDQRDVREAESRVQQLKNRLGTDHPDVLLLDGQVAELKGDLPAAVAAYGKLFDSAKSGGNLVRLTRAQWKAGDVDTALRAMEQWVDEHPKDALVLVRVGTAIFRASARCRGPRPVRADAGGQPEKRGRHEQSGVAAARQGARQGTGIHRAGAFYRPGLPRDIGHAGLGALGKRGYRKGGRDDRTGGAQTA